MTWKVCRQMKESRRESALICLDSLINRRRCVQNGRKQYSKFNNYRNFSKQSKRNPFVLFFVSIYSSLCIHLLLPLYPSTPLFIFIYSFLCIHLLLSLYPYTSPFVSIYSSLCIHCIHLLHPLYPSTPPFVSIYSSLCVWYKSNFPSLTDNIPFDSDLKFS